MLGSLHHGGHHPNPAGNSFAPATPRMPFAIQELLGLSGPGSPPSYPRPEPPTAASLAPYGMYSGFHPGPPMNSMANPSGFPNSCDLDAARQHFLAAAAASGNFDPMMVSFRQNSINVGNSQDFHSNGEFHPKMKYE